MLISFEVIANLRINMDKREILPVGSVENLEELALELGCKVGKLSSLYLGLPLGAPHKSMAVWDGVEERLRRRLALWKMQYISKRGRLTLIQSTLSSMPIYYMSILHMPRSVRLRLEQIQRDFLWGGGGFGEEDLSCFFFRSETKRNILIEGKIQEKEKKKETKETTRRMRGPSYTI